MNTISRFFLCILPFVGKFSSTLFVGIACVSAYGPISHFTRTTRSPLDVRTGRLAQFFLYNPELVNIWKGGQRSLDSSYRKEVQYFYVSFGDNSPAY
jgi:hypothetical protein